MTSFVSLKAFLRGSAALSGCVAFVALSGGAVQAQATVAAAQPVTTTTSVGTAEAAQPEIVVTGSLLRSSRANDANPVQILTAAEIGKTSATNVGDYLQHIPSIGSTGSTNARSNAGAGLNCADIRNLGQSRVLVIVDGRRQVQTMAPGAMCVDLNQIPVSQIGSVEMLKDGGSELYGADAVSGVINIKLKHDIDGAGITMRGGITSYGDNRTGMISAYKGKNFADGRGNITIFGQFRAQSGTYQRDRAFSRLASSNNPAPGAAAVYGSGLASDTRVDPSGINLISNNDGTFSRFTSARNYNYANDQMMTGRTRDGSVSVDGHYAFSDALNFYVNGNYTNRFFHNQSAGAGVQGSGVTSSSLLSTLTLPAANPYNIWGRNVTLYKRFEELGGHPLNVYTGSYQIVAGLNGRIFGNWNYDTSLTYGKSTSTLKTQNNINYQHLLQELGVRQTTASSSSAITYDPTVCTSQAGCVLVNPFQPWSGAAADYIATTTTDRSQYQMLDYNLRMNNDRLLQLPYAGGGALGVAFGLEHRWEHGRYTPDGQIVAGNIAGLSSASTAGGFSVTELYGEAKLPLLRNVTGFHDLTVDLQGRWSDYSTSGSTRNWKVGANWAPIRDIRFRGTLGTSYRQPSIYELYGGQTLALASAIDPCAQSRTYGASAAAVVATCAANGVNTSSFTSAYSGQLPTLSGGNSALKPEHGRTYTFGTVVTPHWIPGLNVSAEYWHYKISNIISTLPTQYIVDQCYTGGNSSYCGFIAPRSSSGQLTEISATYQNLGNARTDGIDIDLSYNLKLTAADTITLSNNLQKLLNYEQQNRPGGSWYNYTGRVLYTTSIGYPTVKDYASLTWKHDRLSATYMMNYTSGMRYNNGSVDLTATTNQYYKVGAVVAHDMEIEYDFDRLKLQLGINNMFNRQAPYIPTAVYNTAAGLYGEEMMGRYIWIQAGFKF